MGVRDSTADAGRLGELIGPRAVRRTPGCGENMPDCDAEQPFVKATSLCYVAPGMTAPGLHADPDVNLLIPV